MADQELKIQIITEADNSGFKSVTAATDDFKASTNAAAGATEKHTEKMEGAGKVFGVINKIAPELGHALHAAFLGPLGPLVLLGMGISAVKDKLADYNAELDAMGADAFAPHAASIKQLQADWDAASAAIGKYYAAMATAGGGDDPIKKQLDNIKQVSDAQIDSIKKITEALGQQEIAYLKANGASPEQVAAAEARNAAQQGKLDSQKDKADGVDGLKSEQEMRQKKDAELQREANARMEEARKAQARLESHKAELAGLQGEGGVSPADAKIKKLDALEESFDRVRAGKPMASDILAVDSYSFMNKNAGRSGNGYSQLQEDQTAAYAERDREQRRRRQLESGLHVDEQLAAEAATRSTDAQRNSVTNRTRLNQLPGEIAQAQTVQGTKDNGRDITEQINKVDKETGMSLGQMGAAAHLNQSQIITIAKQLISGQMTHAQEIAGLKVAMAAAERQTKAASGNTR